MKSRILFFYLFYFEFIFGQLSEITSKVDNNPAQLNAFIHIPNNKWKTYLPIVVVLHGCTQTAKEIYHDAGWEKLSDSLGFMVLLPEQRIGNNSGRCFNWYKSENQTNEGDEIQSIFSMLDYVQQKFQTDSSKTYIYGVSAGAVMAVNCIFLHPERFRGAAILAGKSFGVTDSNKETLKSLFNAKLLPDSVLLNPGVSTAEITATFPKTIVVIGDKDKIVNPIHTDNLVRQISLVRNLNTIDTSEIQIINTEFPIRQINYENVQSGEKLAYLQIHNWGHYLMVDPGENADQGGHTSTLSKDGDFWSTLYLVNFWLY